MAKQWQPLIAIKEFVGNLFKDWKPIAVIGVLLWSVFTLFQIEPEQTLNRWQELASLSPQELKVRVQHDAEQLKEWPKMNSYEREDTVKRMLEEAQLANNIQVIYKHKGYVLFTSLKLGLDLRGARDYSRGNEGC